MSTSITQWEVFPGSIEGHEVRLSPLARRATCSCGEWSVYGVAPRDLPAAAGAHIAEAKEKALGRASTAAERGRVHASGLSEEEWARAAGARDWRFPKVAKPKVDPLVAAVTAAHRRPKSRGEQLIEELGGAAAARKATHPDTRDPEAGFTDADFRAVQAAVGLGVMEGGRG